MTIKPLKQYFQCSELELPVTGAKVSGVFITRDKRIFGTSGRMNVQPKGDKPAFSFTLNQSAEGPDGSVPENWQEPTMSTTGVPAGVSAETIVQEFKDYVIESINGMQ